MLKTMRMRKFQISSDLFWGWQTYVDIKRYPEVKDIAEIVKADLVQHLKEKNLMILAEKAAQLQLHCHDTIADKEGIIYLCDHCKD